MEKVLLITYKEFWEFVSDLVEEAVDKHELKNKKITKEKVEKYIKKYIIERIDKMLNKEKIDKIIVMCFNGQEYFAWDGETFYEIILCLYDERRNLVNDVIKTYELKVV